MGFHVSLGECMMLFEGVRGLHQSQVIIGNLLQKILPKCVAVRREPPVSGENI